MRDAYICDAIRTPIGRYGGVLATVRADDLAAVPIRALVARNAAVDWGALDDVVYGCANQAGEDNRNVARMAALLAGLPVGTPGVTVNRLCGSGLDAVAMAARAIRTGEAELVIAGGVESMSRAPFVLSKAEAGFARDVQLYDTTMGWRFVNPLLRSQYGVDSMPETAENVAAAFGITRVAQDAFALRSQQRALAAQASGAFAEEITPVHVRSRKGETVVVDRDEHPRQTSLEALARLGTPFRDGGTVTAGNASGVNDGACALLLASESAMRRHGLSPRARVAAAAVAGVEPRAHGHGPGACDAQAAGAATHGRRRPRARRVERGLCGAGTGGVARTRPARRCAAREPAGRRHRPGTPARHERRPARDDGDVPDAAVRRA